MIAIRSSCVALGVTLLLLSAALAQAGEGPPRLIRSASPDWPQWRGPRRDGISDETTLLPSWPVDGPNRLWTADGLGRGYSSPIIVGENIFITGDEGNDLVITALTASGQRRWQAKNGAAWKGPYPGARASCCFDDGRLYHMNAHGRLAYFDAASGKERWAVNTLEKFKAENITWGISECLLVHGDRVFATPAGSEGLCVALDKRTGATAWTTPALANEKASYSSPILLSIDGREILVNCGTLYAFAVDTASGKLLWNIAHTDPKNAVTSTPVYSDGRVFITNSSRYYGAMFCVELGGLNGTKSWWKELTVSHGGMICAEGRLCGSSSRGELRGWIAVEPATGRPAPLAELPGGSLIYADKRFYCLTERGTMFLQELAPDGFKTHGRFVLAEGRDVWAHPVICNGRLFLRYDDTLYCYDIRSQ